MKPLHIFKPGNYVGMDGSHYQFSEADLAATVRAYDPALHEAPLVIGHPRHNAPAAGWVKALQATDDGLIAEPQQVDAAFAEQIARGSYKKISASFYGPNSPSNPVPGVYYLRHVGFLGAQPPAVKGLRAIELADCEEGVIEFADFGHEMSAGLWRKLREWLINKFGTEEADKVIPTWEIDSIAEVARQADKNALSTFSESPLPEPQITEETTVTDTAADIATLQADNQRLQRELKAMQDKQKQQVAQERHTANAEFAESLISTGKLLPKHAAALIAALDFAESADQPLEFGEGIEKQPLVAGLKSIFSDFPERISFAEQATKQRSGNSNPTSDPAFAEKNTDPGRMALHNQARALAADKKITYESAVRQLISQ